MAARLSRPALRPAPVGLPASRAGAGERCRRDQAGSRTGLRHRLAREHCAVPGLGRPAPGTRLAAAESAAANAVGERLRVHHDAARLPARADLLIANILASSLCMLVREFALRLGEGGQLLLSGILAEQAEAVAVVYAPWFDVAPS